MKAIHITEVIAAIQRESHFKPSALAGVSRETIRKAQSGQAVAFATASKLIAAARQLISPDIDAIVDGSGRRHLANDVIEQAEAEIARLKESLAAAQRETATLRRLAWTRLRTASL